MNNINTSSWIRSAKNFLSSSLVEPARPPETISRALKFRDEGRKLSSPHNKGDKDNSVKDKLFSQIKKGHLFGAAVALVSLFSKSFVAKDSSSDDKIASMISRYSFLGTIAGLGSIAFASFAKRLDKHDDDIDQLVQRFEVDAEGNSTEIKDGGKSNKFPELDDVVMSEANREEFDSSIDILNEKERGGVFCFRGLTRCGKTMTSKALARNLANEYGTKAQYWYASEDTMSGTIADQEKMFGDILGIEPTIKKIERLIARAIVESENGTKPIVIVLDEAHKMLGVDTFMNSNTKNYDSSNPHQTSKLVESLKRLFSETLNTKNCKGIYLVMTANSSADEIAAPMKERMIADIFYDKPHQEEREKFFKLILEREFKEAEKKDRKIDFEFDSITDEDISKLASIGTCNLLNQFSANDEDRAFDEAVRAGFGGNIEELRERPMINYEAIEKIVISKVSEYSRGKNAGGKDALMNNILQALEKRLKGILSQKGSWRKELLYYFGAKSDQL